MAEAASKTAATKKPTNIIEIISRIADEAGALAPTTSPQGGVPFKFRGVDAVVAHVAPLMNEYGVFNTARVVEKETSTRILHNKDGSENGKAITETRLTVEYEFFAPDGSSVKTQAAGLAQDYADRSAAQAQSVAYRVAILQLFHLPTHDKEPEEVGAEVQRQTEEDQAKDKSTAPAKVTVASIKQEMGALLDSTKDFVKPVVGDEVNALMAEITGDKPANKWTVDDLAKGKTKLEAIIAERAKETKP